MPAENRIRSRAFGREALVFLAFLALTVAMTWPWARHLRDHASDAGDPYLNSWILWWDFHQTFHSPFHLFDGNIFFPYKLSLAFSEHNYGLALPLFPLFALGLRPLTAQGILTLLGFAFSGYGAFRLGRTLTGSTGAAWVAGVAFAFVPYRFRAAAARELPLRRLRFRFSSRRSSSSCARGPRGARHGSAPHFS